MRLKNKTAIVTGAGRGMGRVIALALSREGANVAISDINLKEATAVIQGFGNVGATSAKFLAEKGCQIIAATPPSTNRVLIPFPFRSFRHRTFLPASQSSIIILLWTGCLRGCGAIKGEFSRGLSRSCLSIPGRFSSLLLFVRPLIN